MYTRAGINALQFYVKLLQDCAIWMRRRKRLRTPNWLSTPACAFASDERVSSHHLPGVDRRRPDARKFQSEHAVPKLTSAALSSGASGAAPNGERKLQCPPPPLTSICGRPGSGQSVWKNLPRAASTRSYVCAPK